MLNPAAKRLGAQRLFSPGAAYSAFKSEKLQNGFQPVRDDSTTESQIPIRLPVASAADVRGPFLSQDSVWRYEGGMGMPFGSSSFGGGPPQRDPRPHDASATQPSLQFQQALSQTATYQPLTPTTRADQVRRQAFTLQGVRGVQEVAPLVYDASQLGVLDWVTPLTPTVDEGCDAQPARDMEAFLQELSLSDASSSQAELTYLDSLETANAAVEYNVSSPMATGYEAVTGLPVMGTGVNYDPFLTLAIVDPMKAAQHLNAMSFDGLEATVCTHIWNTGPVPDIALFYLFRKVHGKEQADRAITALVTDREVRTSQGITTPYSEVTSAAVFNALNRTGGENFVVAAAEKAFVLGLTLSRSNMYHLMKQYSVQGKVDHVEKLFRALEASGKSWNSNCIVIMMLAYFNQGRFEDAQALRLELNARGFKISERIEARLDKLLAGEEKWRWEDKVFYRPRRAHLAPPPGFQPLHNTIRPITTRLSPQGAGTMISDSGVRQSDSFGVRGLCSQATAVSHQEPEREYILTDGPPVTLSTAVVEPRIHLNVLRSAGFEDLYNVLSDFVRTKGPVENVCISFLFRKVETKRDVEKAMAFLKEERATRAAAGISEEYNETTCSRIFTALFRTGASDLAFAYAENANQTGLVLSGKALHELLKSFATRNDVEKVEEIWKLVKLNGKPSSRIVYSIFRTYFDNGMMERARAFHTEIQGIGIKLSASATRNIEDVLSGAKSWVRDPHTDEF